VGCRNGLFIAELTALLTGEAVPGCPREPRSVDQACRNVQLVLAALQSRVIPAATALVLPRAEEIVQAERWAMWGLLAQLKEEYPNATPAEDRYAISGGSALGYNAREMKQLAEATAGWIHSLGLLGLVPGTLEGGLPRYEEIEGELMSGSLLCGVAGHLAGHGILGVVAVPRTEASKAGNIRKAVGSLRSHPMMAKRFVGEDAVERVMGGDAGWVLGMLEDARRAADGLPPRSLHKGHGGGGAGGSGEGRKTAPYLGPGPTTGQGGRRDARAARARRLQGVLQGHGCDPPSDRGWEPHRDEQGGDSHPAATIDTIQNQGQGRNRAEEALQDATPVEAGQEAVLVPGAVAEDAVSSIVLEKWLRGLHLLLPYMDT